LLTTDPALAALWRMAYQLAIWLALVPFVAGAMIGRLGGGGQVQSPLAIVLVAILLVPLMVVLQALWRTRELPAAGADSAANP
jgi:hypothetical protein